MAGSPISLPFAAPGIPLGGESATSGGTDLVPLILPVALGGVPYFLDESDGPGLRHASAARIRAQADQGRRPGEQSLNPEGDWRRSFQSWGSGAGQRFADAADSLDDRFRTSKGIDVWSTDGEITLLPGTAESRSSTNTNLYMAVAGSRLYVTDGATSDANLLYTTDPFAASPTYTAVTGTTPAIAAGGIASAGHHIFIAWGSSGIWHTENDAATASSWVTGTVEDVWYAKGRIIASNGADIFNPTTSWTGGPAALPTALFTHPNDEWTWVDVAEGLNHIYLGGNAGDRSEVYRTQVKPDGTALDVPISAGRLPDGEVLRSLETYLEGFVLLGTDKGVRIASTDTNGDLLLGPLIETGSPCRAFEGQGRFVWFGWETYDSTSGGLGRIDLTTTTQRGAPAYASDLMHTTQADIVDVATFSDKRIFSVSGDGFYAQDTDLVSSGTVTTGDITFGLTEHKLAKRVEVRSCDLSSSSYGGSFSVALSVDSGASFSTVGEAVSNGTIAVIDAGETLAVAHDIQLTLTRDGTDATLGPCITGVTLRVHPHSDATRYIVAKLLIGEVTGVEVGTGYPLMDPAAQLASVESMHESQNIVKFQSLSSAYSVTVEDYDFAATSPSEGRSGWNGTMTVRLKRV